MPAHTSLLERPLSRSPSPLFRLLLLFVLLASPGPAQPLAAQGTTITVTTLNDELNQDGDCSLREAIQAANTNTAVDACPAGVTSQDIILLAEGIYTLSRQGAQEDGNQTGDLDILSPMRIQGQGADKTIIDAGRIDRVMDVLDFNDPRVMEVELVGVTLRNGQTPAPDLFSIFGGDGWQSEYSGGAIRNSARLTIRNSRLTGNLARIVGGGIISVGYLRLVNSSVSNNQTTYTIWESGLSGMAGGILADGTILLEDSSVNDNIGGGIFNVEGNLELLRSTVQGNSNTRYHGGGIANLGGRATLVNSMVLSNSAVAPASENNVHNRGGGLANLGGSVTLVNSAVLSNTAKNDGGGIWSIKHDTMLARLILQDSEVSYNAAGEDGGGIYVQDPLSSLVMSGSNVHHNTSGSSRGNGGGIINEGAATITDSSISYNRTLAQEGQAGGLGNAGVVELTRSLVNGNQSGNGAGLFNTTVMTMTGTTVQENSSEWAGGGIRNDGILTLISSQVLSNTVTRSGPFEDTARGGGIFNVGRLTIREDSAVAYNHAWIAGGIFSGFCQNQGGVLHLEQSRVERNHADLWGGGIANEGVLTLLDSTVKLNEAANGAGISSGLEEIFTTPTGQNGVLPDFCQNSATPLRSTLTITRSTIAENRATIGGGIINFTRMQMDSSTVISNTATSVAGGIANNGTLQITASRISANRAEQFQGGGLLNDNETTISGSIVSDNSAGGDGGGIQNGGGESYRNEWAYVPDTASVLTITETQISGNQAGGNGGGLFNTEAGSLVRLMGSTMSGNQAGGSGGALATDADVELTSVTLSGNSAALAGGGAMINASGILTVTGSTISHNQVTGAGGVGDSLFNNGVTRLQHTIVATGAAGACAGAHQVLSEGYNLLGDSSCVLAGVGDLVGLDLLLGPLADNGGPTLTHALLPGSPALEAGDNNHCLAVDQRGAPRPQDADGDGNVRCDIGAYEAATGSTLPTATPSPTVTSTATPTATPIPEGEPGAPTATSTTTPTTTPIPEGEPGAPTATSPATPGPEGVLPTPTIPDAAPGNPSASATATSTTAPGSDPTTTTTVTVTPGEGPEPEYVIFLPVVMR